MLVDTNYRCNKTWKIEIVPFWLQFADEYAKSRLAVRPHSVRRSRLKEDFQLEFRNCQARWRRRPCNSHRASFPNWTKSSNLNHLWNVYLYGHRYFRRNGVDKAVFFMRLAIMLIFKLEEMIVRRGRWHSAGEHGRRASELVCLFKANMLLLDVNRQADIIHLSSGKFLQRRYRLRGHWETRSFDLTRTHFYSVSYVSPATVSFFVVTDDVSRSLISALIFSASVNGPSSSSSFICSWWPFQVKSLGELMVYSLEIYPPPKAC